MKNLKIKTLALATFFALTATSCTSTKNSASNTVEEKAKTSTSTISTKTKRTTADLRTVKTDPKQAVMKMDNTSLSKSKTRAVQQKQNSVTK